MKYLLLFVLLMSGCAANEPKPFICSSTDETVCALEERIYVLKREHANRDYSKMAKHTCGSVILC